MAEGESWSRSSATSHSGGEASVSQKEKSSHRERSSSYEAIPPNLSGLNVILLGNSLSLKNFVGKLLLINTEIEPENVHTYEGKMDKQPLTVVMTPDLHETNRHEFIDCIKTLRGPRVFLLVLQPENFSEEHKDKLQSLLESCSDKAFNQSLVLISTGQAERPGIMKKVFPYVPSTGQRDHDRHVTDMIVKCKYRYLYIYDTEEDLNQTQFKREELKTRISETMKENRENYTEEKTLNLVLCGRAGADKSSVLESITGQSSERLSQEPCEKHQAEVCGRWVSVLELPPLSGSDKPVEEVMEHCLSLCGPQGVQAFILVLPLGHFTDEDKSELKNIQEMFSSAVCPFTMVLFTVDSEPSDPVSVGRDLQELCQHFRGGYLTFNTRGQHQVALLLDSVEKLRAKNQPHSYTMKTLVQGYRRMFTTQTPQIQVSGAEASDCLRIALLGKTGSGKSSSGNTILGRAEFEAVSSSSSVTQSCAKAETEVDGQRVVVVDTPGLFDSRIAQDEIIDEMTKCVSLLAPGPHVILLVLQLGRFTDQEKNVIELIKKAFGKESQKYTMILFTRGDDLDSSFEMFLEHSDSSLKKLLSDHGNRVHVFNNRDKANVSQVKQLIEKIKLMVQENGGGCYTNHMFQNAEATIRKEMERIMKEREEEMETKHLQEMEEIKQKMEKEKEKTENERKQREQELRETEERVKREEALRKEEMERVMKEKEKEMCKEREEMERQCQNEMEEIKQEMDKQKKQSETEIKERERELREKEERNKKEGEQRKKEQKERNKEERKRREREERQREEWEQKQKELEEKIRSESESKETIDQKLQESRRKMEEEREKWEKERKEWWQQRKEEDEERKQKLQNLQDEHDRQRRADQEQRQEEERMRKQREEEKMRELEKNHEREMEDSKSKAENEARREAEEEFQKQEKQKLAKHRKNINDLVRCICKKKNNVKMINEQLKEHENQMSKETDEKRKEAMLKEQEKELSELIQKMLAEEDPSVLQWVNNNKLSLLLTAIIVARTL